MSKRIDIGNGRVWAQTKYGWIEMPADCDDVEIDGREAEAGVAFRRLTAGERRRAERGEGPEPTAADPWTKGRRDEVFCGLFLRCLTTLDVVTAEARAEAALDALEARGLVEAMHDVLTNRSVWAPDNIPVDVR